MAYSLSRKADEDIFNIFVEGARMFGLEQAEKYHADLEKVFSFLSDHPEAARERHEITPPVRCHPCGAHMVIYTILQTGDILIVRVRHSHEDWRTTPV